MTTTRRRRIVWRAALALAGIVLIPLGYLSGLLIVFFGFGVGWISDPMAQVYEVPWERYGDAEMPCRHEVDYAIYWSCMMGQHFGNCVYRGIAPPDGEPLVQPPSEVIPH